MRRHVALVVHPDSGKGAAARVAGTVAARLRRHVARLDLIAVTTAEQAQAELVRSRDEGLDTLVVLGGDGAVHRALQFCAEAGVALGVVPCGTGNDFARAMGLPQNPARAVDAVTAALREGRTRTVDLGQIDLGQAGRRWFGTVLCSGFDAAVNARANRMAWPSGPRRYDLAVVAELASFRAQPLTVTTDTGRWRLDATLVAVGNTGWYGAGIPICPSAQPDDGLVDVTVVGRTTRRQLVRMLPTLRSGDHVDHPAVRTVRARKIMLSGHGWPAYADGEPVGTLPLSVTCVPAALTILG